MQGRGRESIARTVAMNREAVFKHQMEYSKFTGEKIPHPKKKSNKKDPVSFTGGTVTTDHYATLISLTSSGSRSRF
jgi:hypothetical protein